MSLFFYAQFVGNRGQGFYVRMCIMRCHGVGRVPHGWRVDIFEHRGVCVAASIRRTLRDADPLDGRIVVPGAETRQVHLSTIVCRENILAGACQQPGDDGRDDRLFLRRTLSRAQKSAPCGA